MIVLFLPGGRVLTEEMNEHTRHLVLVTETDVGDAIAIDGARFIVASRTWTLGQQGAVLIMVLVDAPAKAAAL